MPAASKHSVAAGQYAQALLELANERGEAETIGQELSDLDALVETNPTFGLFLRDPAVSESDRQQTLERIFRGRVSPLLFNTLGVLNGKKRLGILPEIAQQYEIGRASCRERV